MMDDLLQQAFSTIAERVVEGATLLRHWPLTGGVSAQVHALEIARADGGYERVVVRRHGSAAWKPLADDVTAVEFQLLRALHDVGLPVPQPLLLDTSCEILPSPFLVMTLVEGSTAIPEGHVEPALRQMASFLAQLHGLDLLTLELPRLERREDPLRGALDYLPSDAGSESLRAVICSYVTKCRKDSLLHGDYWPGNVLWAGGRLAAVIDWEDAAIGPPASDLACCRAELNALHGESAMHDFTRYYLAASACDVSDLPLWEVYVGSAALATMHEWRLPPRVEATRRERTVEFVVRAKRELLQRE